MAKLGAFIDAGKPVLLTDELAQSLTNRMKLDAAKVYVVLVRENPKSLLELSQKELDALRAPLLRALKVSFRAPNRVALYFFGDGSWVVENFNDEAVDADLNGKRVTVAAGGWVYQWK